MRGNEAKLLEYMEGAKKRFVIPVYQRNYAWEKDEIWAKQFAEERQLSDEAMDGLLSGMGKGVISKYSGANATPKRIEFLAKGHRIRYSNKLYQALRDIGNDSHIVYAAMFIKEFCNEYSDGIANRDDVKKLFESDRISRRNMPMAVNTVKEIVLANEDLIVDVALYVNVGNYSATADLEYDANNYYTPEIGGCEWSISKAVYDMSKTAWQGVTGFTFDGNAKTVELTGLPEGITPVYEGNMATDAGSYSASVTLEYDADNYEKPTFSGCNWSIAPAAVDVDTSAVEWVYDGPYMYDGTPKSVCIATKTQPLGFFEKLRGVEPSSGRSLRLLST